MTAFEIIIPMVLILGGFIGLGCTVNRFSEAMVGILSCEYEQELKKEETT